MELSNGGVMALSIVGVGIVVAAVLTIASPQGEDAERLRQMSNGGTKRRQNKRNKSKKNK